MKKEIKENKCGCSFCKLREIEMNNCQEEIIYLNKKKNEVVEKYQDRRKELVELCVKNKLNYEKH